MTDTISIRLATREDVPVILALIKELAGYEKALNSVQATESSLLQTLTFAPSSTDSSPQSSSQQPNGFAKTFLLRPPKSERINDIEVAGMALFFYNYSTWRAAPGVFLEDLFVRPEYRRRGYATMLIRELAREVKRVKGKRLEWKCLKWNEPSLNFYKGLGAEQMSEWVGLRVDGEALEKLAERDV
ncbi:MAG: hypothetical protein M1821_008221 [Bathelium mastoideum]|nr:MAG: hypothetical protein M1821_008221 [Bathelium mastoideum]